MHLAIRSRILESHQYARNLSLMYTPSFLHSRYTKLYRALFTTEYVVSFLLDNSCDHETLYYCYKELIADRQKYMQFVALYKNYLFPGTRRTKILREKERISSVVRQTVHMVETSINIPLLARRL